MSAGEAVPYPLAAAVCDLVGDWCEWLHFLFILAAFLHPFLLSLVLGQVHHMFLPLRIAYDEESVFVFHYQRHLVVRVFLFFSYERPSLRYGILVGRMDALAVSSERMVLLTLAVSPL